MTAPTLPPPAALAHRLGDALIKASDLTVAGVYVDLVVPDPEQRRTLADRLGLDVRTVDDGVEEYSDRDGVLTVTGEVE